MVCESLEKVESIESDQDDGIIHGYSIHSYLRVLYLPLPSRACVMCLMFTVILVPVC